MNLRRNVEDALLEVGRSGVNWRKKRVAVVVPDATRPLDLDAVVAPLLEFLCSHGASPAIAVALGLHRPMKNEELAGMLSIAQRFGVAVSQHDTGRTVPCGPPLEVPGGPVIPRAFFRAVADTDLIFVTGVVEPHQYAGFSGGAKTVAIGCASRETIGAMHGLHFLRDPRMRLGDVAENPFQRAIGELVRDLPEIFALQIVGGESAFAGPWAAAFANGVREAVSTLFEPVEEELDYAVLRVPAVKAKSFYQASRAATYVSLIDRPAVRKDGWLVLDASCPEGIGEGEGELACRKAMARGRDRLLAELRGEVPAPDASGGAQRAYVLAKALANHQIAIAGAPYMPELDSMGIAQVKDTGALALGGHGRIFDDVFLRVPRYEPER